MALVYFDSFENYKKQSELLRVWKVLDSKEIFLAYVYNQSLYGKNTASMLIDYKSTNHIEVAKYVDMNDNDFIIGFYFKINYIQQEALDFEADENNYITFCRLFDGKGSLIVALGINPFWGRLFLAKSTSSSTDSNTLIYSSPLNLIRNKTFYFIELKGSVSSNANFELRIDNETITTHTGIDTVNPSESIQKKLVAINFRPSTANGIATTRHWIYTIDDMYVCDTTGTKFNDFLGPHFIKNLKIKSEITNQWGVNGASTSISAITDFDINSYITTTTTSASAVFQLSANTTNIDNFQALKIETKYHNNTGSDANSITFIEVSGITGRNIAENPIPNGFIRQYTIFENKPDGTDWNRDDLNNLFFGVKKK